MRSALTDFGIMEIPDGWKGALTGDAPRLKKIFNDPMPEYSVSTYPGGGVQVHRGGYLVYECFPVGGARHKIETMVELMKRLEKEAPWNGSQENEL